MDNDEDLKCNDCNNDISNNSAYLTQDGSMVCEKCAAPLLASLNSPAHSSTIIPDQVLDKLKCSECSEYLSCGPIYLNENVTYKTSLEGSAVCGRCVPSDNSPIRLTQYEALAQLMLFPCKFKKLGCSESVPFSYSLETDHEKSCSFRKDSCPIMAPLCQWLGSRSEFVEHCRQNHADRVVENPCNLSYSASVDSICNFLLVAFDDLFVFHTKVCTKTCNIYHTVQHVGEPDINISDKYDFTVNILRNNKMVRRSGQVTRAAKFDYNSKTFLITNIKNLEKALEGFDNCVFTITVNKISTPEAKCVKCDTKIEQFLYQEKGKWFCKKCIPENTIQCKHKGCTYVDIVKKCRKHEIFFCTRSNSCWLCRRKIRHEDFPYHYSLKHSEISYKEGSAWEAVQTGIFDKMFILPTKACNAIIKYRFNDSFFLIQIRTEISSEHLYEYHCIVKLSIPGDSQKTKIFILNALYNEMHDWQLQVNSSDIQKWPSIMSVIVNIRKGAKPQLVGAKNVIYQ